MKPCLSIIVILTLSIRSFAWIGDFAPNVKRNPVVLQELDDSEIKRYVDTSKVMPIAPKEIFSADLNQDGKTDYVIFIGSGGCGLAAWFGWVYFVLSSPDGPITTRMDCMGFDTKDLIRFQGKNYFIQTTFLSHSAIDGHNYWLYRIFAFGKNGKLLNADKEVGKPFPHRMRYRLW